MKLLVIIGSLRSASFSSKLAHAAATLAPEGTEIEFADGRDLPLYDQDLDGKAKPEPVQTLIEQVSSADGLLFVTPEFNYGIPGPLKNLIDWASRPAFNSPLKAKPALIIAASPAPSGGARAHGQLASVLGGTLAPVFIGPSFVVPAVHEKFDEGGALNDDITKMRIISTLSDFATWVNTAR